MIMKSGTIRKWARKAARAMDATTEKGLRNRVWIAVILSVAATMIDYYFVYPNYSALPDRIPTMHDWDGAATQWGDKSVFLEFEIQRLFSFIFTVGACWLLTNFFSQFMVRRVACFLIEVTMLCITTGVGISLVMLQIAMGDRSAKVSDYWEGVIMLVSIVLMLAELISDCIKIRKAQKAAESAQSHPDTSL